MVVDIDTETYYYSSHAEDGLAARSGRVPRARLSHPVARSSTDESWVLTEGAVPSG